MNRTVKIHLSLTLHAELQEACCDSADDDGNALTPNQFASQCVEAALASRRLGRIQ